MANLTCRGLHWMFEGTPTLSNHENRTAFISFKNICKSVIKVECSTPSTYMGLVSPVVETYFYFTYI